MKPQDEENILSAELQELLQAAGVDVAYAPTETGAYRWVGPGGRRGNADTRFAAAIAALQILRQLAEEHPAVQA